MIAAEHERQLARLAARGNVIGDLAAHDEDLVEVLGVVVPGGERLDRVLGDGSQIVHADAQLGQPADEVGVADRRRSHVDTAATLPEVERGAEQGHVRERLGRAHGLTIAPSSGASSSVRACAPASTPGRRPPEAGSTRTTPPASRTSRSPAA